MRQFATSLRLSALCALCASPQLVQAAPPAPAAGQPPAVVPQEPQPEDEFDWFVADGITYDDNLFRLSPGVPSPDSSGSRAEEINTVSAGLDGQWYHSKQKVAVDLRVDNNTFLRNPSLSNVSGNFALSDHWAAGDRLSGLLEASYTRIMPNFANNRLFFRNLLDDIVFLGEGRYAIGTHWYARAMAEGSRVLHSRTFERVNDSTSRSAGFGLEYENDGSDYVGAETYQTTAQDVAAGRQTIIGVDYWHTDTSYPGGAFLDGEPFDRDFHESTITGELASPLAPKTTLRASGGYLKRDYPGAEVHSYSGVIWDASLTWRMTEQTQISLEGWRALRAFLEVNTDYFVSNLRSITVQWSPTGHLSISAGFSSEHQDYIGASLFATTTAPRVDTVRSGQLKLAYSIGRYCQASLTGNRDVRDSNQPLLPYHDTRFGLSLRVQF